MIGQVFWAHEQVCWWIAEDGALRRYHRGPLPQGPEYARIIPLIRHGTVEEAAEAGYETPCMIAGCGLAEQRRARPLSRWQRGGRLRR